MNDLSRKIVIFIAVMLGVFSLYTHLSAQELPRLSPPASVSQRIGVTDITISYGSPAVRGRVIWGELVPYDRIWRTGANEATTFSVSHEVEIQGKPLPAGKYALFTIPGKHTWKIIFNKKWDQWGTFGYDPALNALEIAVQPEPAPHRERLTFLFEDVTDSTGVVVMHWEKLRIAFPIRVHLIKYALANARSAMASLKPDDWETPYRCARFCFRHNVNLKEASQWLNRSLQIKETYWNVSLMAYFLAHRGEYREAVQMGEKAVQLASQMKNEPGNLADLQSAMSRWEAEIGN